MNVFNFFATNVAARNVLTIPLLALATRMAFAKQIKEAGYNMAELFYIRAFMASQLLFFTLLYLPFNHFKDDGVAWLAEFILAFWVYSQIFEGSKRKIIAQTILMYVYWLLMMLFLIIICLLIIGGFVYIFNR